MPMRRNRVGPARSPRPSTHRAFARRREFPIARRTHRLTIEVDCDEPTDPYRWRWQEIVRMYLWAAVVTEPETVTVRVISDYSFPNDRHGDVQVRDAERGDQ